MPWFDLVSLSGDEGRRWREQYGRFDSVAKGIMGSVPLLRRGEIDTGARMLKDAREQLSAMDVGDESILSVMERWYLGALGMYHYRLAEFDEADRVMARAHEHMVDAVTRRGFLVVLADEAVELRLHRARISRNRQRWAEMWDHISAARAMRAGGEPFYVLRDGRSVWLSDVREFLEALPAAPEQRPVKPNLQDPTQCRQDIDRWIRDVLRIPDSVIHAP
jgi:hypothetical protein